ncbi:hypothetical protein [Moorena sp. SIO4A5]|uniref:hypothetical protein n=1 Tax=Moorena sp. SIO4A5 TaxID=2607838 RepID=UPI0013C8369C|nr:hypothetical protein [Moorena sp. SIO4A5]NEO25096.1 hypothetical protein [Moorena sp. SIO4A5]
MVISGYREIGDIFSNETRGSAGNLKIEANSIFLNNEGIIAAETAGDQGNIRLQAVDIRMRNQVYHRLERIQ